jgi:hypothetical protein
MTAWFREREKFTEIFGFSFLATGRSILWKKLIRVAIHYLLGI